MSVTSCRTDDHTARRTTCRTDDAPVWPAAVSQRSARVLARRPRGATVLAVHPLALYLRVDRSWPDPGLLPVVAHGGLRLPNAAVLASPPSRLGWGVQPGDRVSVGDAEIHLPGATIRRARVWNPVRVPSAGRAGLSSSGALRALASAEWVPPAEQIAAGALAGDSVVDLADLVVATVGAGRGLTPSGDDVLCGLLLALRLAGADDARQRLWSCVRPRLGTTTTVSASLLLEAAEGYAVPAVVRLLAALAGGPGRAAEVLPAAHEVRAIGHSSGADLLAGLVGGLAGVHDRRSTGAVLELRTGGPHLPTALPGAAP